MFVLEILLFEETIGGGGVVETLAESHSRVIELGIWFIILSTELMIGAISESLMIIYYTPFDYLIP